MQRHLNNTHKHTITMVEVRIPMEKEQHEKLSKTKEEADLTWKEMLQKGREKVEG